MEELQETLMFKLMSECHHNCMLFTLTPPLSEFYSYIVFSFSIVPNVKQLLPAIEDLLSSQLLVDEGLDSSPILIYCVKLCYERVTELQH